MRRNGKLARDEVEVLVKALDVLQTCINWMDDHDKYQCEDYRGDYRRAYEAWWDLFEFSPVDKYLKSNGRDW